MPREVGLEGFVVMKQQRSSGRGGVMGKVRRQTIKELPNVSDNVHRSWVLVERKRH